MRNSPPWGIKEVDYTSPTRIVQCLEIVLLKSVFHYHYEFHNTFPNVLLDIFIQNTVLQCCQLSITQTILEGNIVKMTSFLCNIILKINHKICKQNLTAHMEVFFNLLSSIILFMETSNVSIEMVVVLISCNLCIL